MQLPLQIPAPTVARKPVLAATHSLLSDARDTFFYFSDFPLVYWIGTFDLLSFRQTSLKGAFFVEGICDGDSDWFEFLLSDLQVCTAGSYLVFRNFHVCMPK